MALLLGGLVGTAGALADAWQGADPQGDGDSRCMVQSEVQRINDGYDETLVHLVLDQRSLLVIADSTFDFDTVPLGLTVDGGEFIAADRIEKDTRLVFEKDIARITEQFVSGNRARLRLRFWPTWPETGDKFVEFSLKGFSRAFAGLSPCSRSTS